MLLRSRVSQIPLSFLWALKMARNHAKVIKSNLRNQNQNRIDSKSHSHLYLTNNEKELIVIFFSKWNYKDSSYRWREFFT